MSKNGDGIAGVWRDIERLANTPEEAASKNRHKPDGCWAHIVDVLCDNYQDPDLQAARLLCAAVAAHQLSSSPPAWVLAIAPPGSMKTDLLESLRGLPRVHFVDEVTPKTFLSGKVDEPGQKRTKPASWLHRIGSDGIVIGADFSTFTADSKSLAIILAQMRRIYDDNYAREFGTDENQEERSWQGRLTVLAGAVPDIDRHYHLFQKLGERFLRVRWPRAGGIEAGLRAMAHNKELAPKLRESVHALLNPLLSKEQMAPTLFSQMQVRIASLSELIALARSHVERDRYSREVVDVPVTEGNTRLPQQLCQLARGSALIEGRSEVSYADLELVRRAAFDSLPPARWAVLLALMQGRNAYSLGLPSVMTQRVLEDLSLVGLVIIPKGEEARLTDMARRLIETARL